ncbi:MAG: DEAD/DEAH box helicase [Candidatus Aenigmatarchaeota archaeon]
MSEFKKLGIIQPILRVIEEQRFDKPTEIQEKSIPLVIAGKDVIAGSATGSGKTLAFGSGLIQNAEPGQGIQGLVLTPTRELAQQVAEALILFSKYKHLEVTCVYGGASINPQIQGLKSADIVVGTPGRILDHLNRKTLYLGRVKILVLDEADRMLDMGFRDDVEKIIKHCPEKRQTILFSATITDDVSVISKRYMKDPVKISAEAYVDAKKLRQVYYDVQGKMKFSLLTQLLKHEKAGLVMVFCNTRRNTDFVSKNLKLNGINSVAIHGGFSQDKRNKTMKDFHSKNVTVLVCTDVAARGLDIQGVSHVYNYDIPNDSKDYIHRIGRTARAGKEGMVINLLENKDWSSLSNVLDDDRIGLEKLETPRIVMVKVSVERRRRYDNDSRRPPRRDYNKRSKRY